MVHYLHHYLSARLLTKIPFLGQPPGLRAFQRFYDFGPVFAHCLGFLSHEQ